MIDDVLVPTAPAVSFRAVRMSFDAEPVLEGIDLELPPGRTTVLLGPSGVGKTTLVRILLGLYAPESGETLVDGHAVAGLRDAELAGLRRRMGVLLGGSSVYDASLFASLTLFDNVAYPLRAAGAPDADAATWRILHEFDLADHATALPSAVSAGQRRRAALARALVGAPQLLVLDDPGPAMDLHNREQVVRAVRRRAADATALVVTHDLDLARDLGDRVALLLGGRIVADGPVDEVLGGITTAADLDARFGVRASLPVASAAEQAALARRARRQGLGEAWLLMGVLLVMLALLSLALGSGMVANPAI
ncbi:ATP-binding cassette domain-containing protein [Pseudonocardia alni]|uniref:ABC-type transporter Mla maintaining outer membrane lipid asymmetry ATPase subunit MlaF n=1 Tax=Pseudonocardia alni TaxID=33907 RepID=A0A852W8F7_PSEA5|nr:ATP-binding cassette domain-containing protein [Pseudonocardia antarctica]NYG02585.1 ABC-type transporter Mla maintaining outer membrane lipid asymmetry ATPase subunit MlaF [Pseudonocardia antarctica]